MGFQHNLAIRDKLMDMGCTDSDTKWICVHFLTMEMLYKEMTEWAEKENFEVAWDGMEAEF